MPDKQPFTFGNPVRTRTTQAHATAPLFVLYRGRRAAFDEQSKALYRRYGQVLLVLGSMFGLLLVERPGLLAAPLLHFWRAPGVWWQDLAHALSWSLLVAAWTGVHRAFIRGGALGRYVLSLPLAARTPRLVDLAILALSLRVFVLPFAVALWIVLPAPERAGHDGRFWLYGPLLACAAPAVAWAIAYGRGLRAWRVPAVIVALLACLPQLGDGQAAVALAAALGACCLPLPALPTPSSGTPIAGDGAPRSPRFAVAHLVRLQCALLFHRHRADAAMRLCLAALPQLGAWWMIVYAGKTDEAPAFLQVACAGSACLVSGYACTLDRAGQGLRAYLRSMPDGGRRMALAGALLAGTATLGLFGATWLALAWVFGPGHPTTLAMLTAGACWLAVLPLFCLPGVARHRHGVVIKAALAVLTLLIVLAP